MNPAVQLHSRKTCIGLWPKICWIIGDDVVGQEAGRADSASLGVVEVDASSSKDYAVGVFAKPRVRAAHGNVLLHGRRPAPSAKAALVWMGKSLPMKSGWSAAV